MTSEAEKWPTVSGESLFTKIVRKEVDAEIIYEDDYIIAFHDVAPQAPVHFLVVPKKTIDMLENASDEDEALLGKLLLGAKKVAEMLGVKGGYRVVINNDYNAGQGIYHLHLHVIGGGQLGWPPC